VANNRGLIMSNFLRIDLAKMLGKEFKVELTQGSNPSLIIKKISDNKSIRVWASEVDGAFLHQEISPPSIS
jgi:hypothetical protein